MADTVTSLAQKLRPFWLADDANISTIASSGGGGGGGALSSHALSGVYHTGQLAESQATWAGTKAELAAHALLQDAHHARSHSVTSTGDHSIAGAALSLLGATATNTLGLITPSSAPVATAAVLRTTSSGLLTLAAFATNRAASEATFASGFAGSGWRADYGITTAARASIETDDLTVRGRMRVYELLIQQIRATNGSVFVSSASKVLDVDATSAVAIMEYWTVNGEQLYFNGAAAQLTFINHPLWMVNDEQLAFNGEAAQFKSAFYAIATATTAEDLADRALYHGFLVGDIIRAQRFEWNGGSFASVVQSDLEVTSVTDLYHYGATLVSGNAAAISYEYVRLGSASDTSRQGVVYLTSDDSASPFVDIVDGVASHSEWNTPGKIKARLGKLSGISDVDFGGALSGYGLYSENVYLKGQIVVTGGNAATLTDVAGKIGLGQAAADVNAYTTTISGGKITTGSITALQIAAGTITALQIAAGTITTTQLSFTPILGATVVASINASAEGIRIVGSRINIDGNVTFNAGYDPSAKIETSLSNAPATILNSSVAIGANGALSGAGGGQVTVGGIGGIGGGGAAADVNANVTTISGGKITTGTITALGEVASGSIMVGSTNKMWFNQGNDGILAVGGSVKATAPFHVDRYGFLTSLSCDIVGTITASSGGVTGHFYAGTNAIRLSTDGQRFVLPNVTSVYVPSSSSAIRWFPGIDETHTDAGNFTGLVGYRHTSLHTVDMLYTSFVGSTDYTTYAARFILQAGHHDGSAYTDTRLEIVREAGSGAKYAAFYGDKVEFNGTIRAVSIATPTIASGECHTYFKSPYFVIAYNDGGTMKYRYMTLNSTHAGWTYSTTAP